MSPIETRTLVPTTTAASSFNVVEFFRENTPWKVIARLVVHPNHTPTETQDRVDAVTAMLET